MSISGVVISFNEEEGIARCLESLAFCDEIVVVDSNSTDATPSIAARCSAKVITQPFLGYVKQKNFALDQCAHDWVVSLDADEALDPECQRAIQDALAREDDTTSGYVLDRMTYFLGVWHDRGEWYPDRQMRVFRRSRARWVGRDPHDRVELQGPTRQLAGHLRHWNYRDLQDHIAQIEKFSGLQAREMFDEGLRFRLTDLLFRPFSRFFRGYFLRRGFLLGVPGFLVSISTAYYVFMKYARLWELEQGRAR